MLILKNSGVGLTTVRKKLMDDANDRLLQIFLENFQTESGDWKTEDLSIKKQTGRKSVWVTMSYKRQAPVSPLKTLNGY